MPPGWNCAWASSLPGRRKLITCPAISRSNSSPGTGVPMVGLVIGAHAASKTTNSAIHRTCSHPRHCYPVQILGPNAAAGKKPVEPSMGASGLFSRSRDVGPARLPRVNPFSFNRRSANR